MTISLKHTFTNPKADGPDATITRASDWNAEHALTQATSRLLGRTTAAAGATEEISVTAPVTLTALALGVDAGTTSASGVLELATDAETITGTDTARAVTPSNITALFGAWSTYTPTITAGTGTITTSSATGRYKQIGKTVWVEIDITITTVGTGAGDVIATLPSTPRASRYGGNSQEYQNTAKGGWAYISPNGDGLLTARDSTNTTYLASGNKILIGITYEAA